jgi:L-lactate utilization protein LutC
MCENIKVTIENLKKNNINAVFCETKQDALKTVETMLTKGATISSGGSVSLVESGVWDLINNGDYDFKNRMRAGITPEEQQQVFKDIIGIDYYFCSANAVTKSGEILNVDGFSNRISAIAFGPKKVIMVVGKNKIVDNLNDAFLRVKKIAAPKNCVRLGIDNPCAKLGHCISLEKCDNPDFADGCKSARRICVNYLVNGFQRDNGRINVILCAENLGY